MKFKILQFLKMLTKYSLYAFFIQFILVNSVLASVAAGQYKSIREVQVEVGFNQVEVDDIFNQIQLVTDFTFFYDREEVAKNKLITIPAARRSVAELLYEVALQSGLRFRQVNNTISVAIADQGKKFDKANLVIEERDITGRVTDKNGQPLPGTTVMAKGTAIGTTTDVDGNYRLTIPDNVQILIYSFIGFKTVEADVNGRDVINVELEDDIASLDEVVVIGYGTSTKRELTGSVERVTAEQIEQQPVSNVMEALQGRMTGVVVSRESGRIGSSVDIQIRGLNSIGSGRDPLYVIDGVPVTSDNVGNYHFDPMSVINPSDIGSIEILKDADATAIYGSRGSNGVILITTKKAHGGDIQLDVDYSTGISTSSKVPAMLNTQQYLAIRQEALSLAGLEPDNTNAPDLTQWDPNAYTDWVEYAFGQTASRHDMQARISGGKGNTRYTLGGGYFTREDMQSGGAVQERITSHANIQQSSKDERFQSSLSINYSYMGVNSYTYDNSWIAMPPNYPIYDENRDYYWDPEGRVDNPEALQEISSQSGIYNILSSANLSYEILEGLEVKALISYNRQQLEGQQLEPGSSINPFSSTGSGLNNSMFRQGSYQALNFEPQLHYETMLGDGRLRALLGGTWMHQENQTSSVTFEGFSSDALLRDWSAASNVANRFTIWGEYKYQSVFARLNYNWDEKYIINLSARRDGSSRFGPGKQWGNFWAVGAAWVFSNESFIQDALSILSYGKLRASYGLTGNDQIADYGYQETYKADLSTTFNGKSSLGSSLLANPDFSWESTRKLELALEAGLFNDRLLFNAAWYRNRSDNQLIPQVIPSQTGFTRYQANLPALVENRGWEFELQTENIRGNSFSWMTTFNVSLQENELVEYPDIEESPYANSFEVGQPLDRIMLLSFEGIDPANGRAIFTDYNEDGMINDDDDVYIGARSPRAFGGFGNTLSYKGFQLDVFVQFAQQLLPNWKSSFNNTVLRPGNMNNLTAHVLGKYWQQPGDEAVLPAVNTQESTGDWEDDWRQLGGSDAAYDDTFYARLKTLSLYWTIPSRLADKAGLRRVRLYVRGQDLWVFTNNDLGKDPEINYLYSMPIPSTWTGGLQLSL